MSHPLANVSRARQEADSDFGPWSRSIGTVERVARFRVMAALASVFLGGDHEIVRLLRLAERDRVAARKALDVLDHDLPSLPKRRLLATFARLHRPGAWRPNRP